MSVCPWERPGKLNTLAFARLLPGVILLVLSSQVTPGQTFYSFAGGLNVARTTPAPLALHGYTTNGFAAQASVGRQVTRRSGWRLDAFVSQFDLTEPSDFAGVLCAYPALAGTCCGICPRGTSTDRVGITGLTASEFVSVIPSARGFGMYLIGGTEADYVYQHPTAQGALRFGVAAGAGVTVLAGGHRQAFVEARYHYLPGAPSQLRWRAPVTVGV
jgi:hypothetical protein